MLFQNVRLVYPPQYIDSAIIQQGSFCLDAKPIRPGDGANQVYKNPGRYAAESKTRVIICQYFLDSSQFNEVLMGCVGILFPALNCDSLISLLKKTSQSWRLDQFSDGLFPTPLRERERERVRERERRSTRSLIAQTIECVQDVFSRFIHVLSLRMWVSNFIRVPFSGRIDPNRF